MFDVYRYPRVSRILGSDTSDTGTESSHVSEHVSPDNKHYRRAWHIHHSKADSHLRPFYHKTIRYDGDGTFHTQ